MHCLLTLALLAAAPFPQTTDLILIPAGEFTMGGSGSEDMPLHRVRLDAFLLDEHEVTNAQYQAFCQVTDAELPIFWGLARFRCGEAWPDHPVVGVSHNQAEKYAAWAGKRLPTEAEWECAARAGGTGRFGAVDTLTADLANYKISEHQATAPVKSYPPNALGLYDLIGNVREWTADHYGAEIPENQALTTNPTGPDTGRWRVLKGGGWYSGAICNTPTVRNVLPPHWSDFNLGFRCARDVDATD